MLTSWVCGLMTDFIRPCTDVETLTLVSSLTDVADVESSAIADQIKEIEGKDK